MRGSLLIISLLAQTKWSSESLQLINEYIITDGGIRETYQFVDTPGVPGLDREPLTLYR